MLWQLAGIYRKRNTVGKESAGKNIICKWMLALFYNPFLFFCDFQFNPVIKINGVLLQILYNLNINEKGIDSLYSPDLYGDRSQEMEEYNPIPWDGIKSYSVLLS